MRKGSAKKQLCIYFLVCKVLSNDGVWVARGNVFQEVRPEAGFETGDFVKEKGVGGATVERLVNENESASLAFSKPGRLYLVHAQRT